MHLRRALLLFAIVLGLAALAAAVSRPTDDEPAPTETAAPPRAQPPAQPTLSAGTAGAPPKEIAFDVERPRARRLEVGTAATLSVAVEAPGTVTIPGLGLTAAAEPLTPARFDVLGEQPGRYAVEFAPATTDEVVAAGTLVVEPARM